MSNKDFEQGKKDCESFYRSPHFAWITRYVNPRDAMKLFWPSIQEFKTEISSPLPKPRQDWLKGFKEKQVEIQLELGLIEPDEKEL